MWWLQIALSMILQLYILYNYTLSIHGSSIFALPSPFFIYLFLVHLDLQFSIIVHFATI